MKIQDCSRVESALGCQGMYVTVSGVARILKFCRPVAERAPKARAACARAP